MVWMKDANGKYIHANKSFEIFNEFLPDGVVGKTDAEIWPNKLAHELQEADRQAMECEYPVEITENINHPTQGSRWYHTIKVGVCDDKQNPLGTVGISCDVTKQHEQDEILREAIITLTESLAGNELVT